MQKLHMLSHNHHSGRVKMLVQYIRRGISVTTGFVVPSEILYSPETNNLHKIPNSSKHLLNINLIRSLQLIQILYH